MKIDLAIVIGYSKDSLQSREKMRAIMRDLYPNSTLEMNVLLSVYESGIPQIIIIINRYQMLNIHHTFKK